MFLLFKAFVLLARTLLRFLLTVTLMLFVQAAQNLHDDAMSGARIFLPHPRKILLHKAVKAVDRRRSGNGLRLHKTAFAGAAAAALCVDALAVPLELQPTVNALPNKPILNLKAVLSRHDNAPVAKHLPDLRAPRPELAAVRPVTHAIKHKRRKMAKLVGEDVAQAVVVVDDLCGKFNGAVVADVAMGEAGGVDGADRLAPPVRPPGRRVQLAAPD